MKLRAIVIDAKDNVANLIGAGKKDDSAKCTVADEETEVVELLDDIPSNHKFARMDITKGDVVLKYGLSIGTATQDIWKGQYVHIHNIESNRGRGDKA